MKSGIIIKSSVYFAAPCFRITGKTPGTISKKIFYFDTKGRFLKEEKGHAPNRIPKIAYNEKEQIFTEINLEFAEEIHSHTMYTIEKEDGFGLVNHRNEFLIDGLYQKIFVSNTPGSAITHNDNSTSLHLFADKTKVTIKWGVLAV